MHRLGLMAETSDPAPHTRLPEIPSQIVRQRWLDLFEHSANSRRVTGAEIEPGVFVVLVPVSCRKETSRELIDVELRVATGRVPAMGRGLRLSLDRLDEFTLTCPADYRGWMGKWGQEIAAGETSVTAYVDLAYLEAALLARLWDHEVIVDFNSPLAFFRRGALSDYVNVYESAGTMLVAGRSFADMAEELSAIILKRLQLYANVYHQLSSLYGQASWHIEGDSFVVKVAGPVRTLALQYWELRGDAGFDPRATLRWLNRIESFLHKSALGPGGAYPKSFAA